MYFGAFGDRVQYQSRILPGVAMGEADLRDHAEEILTAMGHDMGIAQTADAERAVVADYLLAIDQLEARLLEFAAGWARSP